mgnify:CR=1 FL=1
MMKKILATLKNEDWVIVYAGAIILLLAVLFPEAMPSMPKKLADSASWIKAATMFVSILGLTYLCQAVLRRPLKGIFCSLLVIFALSLGAQVVANIPIIKEWGLESVFFSVIFGLIVSNIFRVPDWLKPAIQSEFYIKIGIVCLGSTILFGEVLKSGVFGLAQALIVVFCVWFFAYRISRKMGVDDEMSTMLASSVSICGVSAAIATAGVIKGDNKKLSYIISLVLVCAIPMMYLMPWIANLIGLNEEVAGAWLGGTIDTTGAVAASGTMLGEAAAQTAIIVKSSQNVLLGIAAFIISLMWTYKGEVHEEKPTLGVIWDRFPKFVVGFILASLVFSFLLDVDCAKSVGKITKGFTNTLFSIAFVCVGLETRFADIFSKENRRPMWAFLTAQGFNIVVTLIVAWVLFGIIKPLLA